MGLPFLWSTYKMPAQLCGFSRASLHSSMTVCVFPVWVIVSQQSSSEGNSSDSSSGKGTTPKNQWPYVRPLSVYHIKHLVLFWLTERHCDIVKSCRLLLYVRYVVNIINWKARAISEKLIPSVYTLLVLFSLALAAKRNAVCFAAVTLLGLLLFSRCQQSC